MSDQSAKEIAFELTNRLDEARFLFHRLAQKLAVSTGEAPEASAIDISAAPFPPDIWGISDPDERRRVVEAFIQEAKAWQRDNRPPLYESDIEKVHEAFRQLGGCILEVTDRIDEA